MKFSFRNMKLANRLIFSQAAFTIVLLTLLAFLAGQLIKHRFTSQGVKEMTDLNRRIIDMIDVYNMKLKEHAESLGNVFINYGVRETENREVLQTAIDRYTRSTGAVATFFVRRGDDFLRVSTSLRKQDGTRAVGTLLDRKHPGYANVLAGLSYTGPAVLFGRNYMTHYLPVKNKTGIAGIYFIGIDFTEGVRNLKDKIRTIEVASTGFISIIEGPGSDNAGSCIVHKSKDLEGTNLSHLRDIDGEEYIKTMIGKKNGTLQLQLNRNETDRIAGNVITAFNYYEPWNWVIASNAEESRLIASGTTLRDFIFAGFLICCCLLLMVLLISVKRIIIVRFRKLIKMAENLGAGAGDLTVRLDEAGSDEIAEMSAGFNRFLEGFEHMVKDILAESRSLVRSVEAINQGNQSLSQRTTEQSSSLEEIASTIEDTLSSLTKMTESASTANKFMSEQVERAEEGNSVAAAAVEAINEINTSSSKIMEILNLIREITFQTNLLSLNAAVEAARAGEHGRGFAIVAGEVRNLAHRSATAASDIEKIISDSIEKISIGTTMIQKTSEALTTIAASVKEISGIISEVSRTSSEQKQEMAQINSGVSEIDKTTQQNAALVEETASLSEEMFERAKKLMNMLESFHVSAG